MINDAARVCHNDVQASGFAENVLQATPQNSRTCTKAQLRNKAGNFNTFKSAHGHPLQVGVCKIRGTSFGGPHYKDYSIWGSTL